MLYIYTHTHAHIFVSIFNKFIYMMSRENSNWELSNTVFHYLTFILVRLDPVRSADPPTNSGRLFAMILIISSDLLRVATAFASYKQIYEITCN